MAPHLADAAAQILPTTPLDMIAYSCTSGTVSIGPDEVTAQIRKGRPGVNVVTPITAALAAFETLGIKRISLMTPYTDDVNRTMAGFLEQHGVEIANVAGFCLEDDQEMARLTPDGIRSAALEIADPDADAVFVSCTGIRSAEAIEAIETALAKAGTVQQPVHVLAISAACGLHTVGQRFRPFAHGVAHLCRS